MFPFICVCVLCVVVSSSVPKRLTRTTIVLTRLFPTQQVHRSRQYNRNYLRLWFRCWSSPYLFSLILSLTIEIYFSPINKLHSVPQVLIPILIEMFMAFSYRLLLRCSTFAFFFIRNWHVSSIVTKAYEIVISRIIKF